MKESRTLAFDYRAHVQGGIDIEGLNHSKRMFALTEGLLRRKYSDSEIEGILGGNFERVLAQIWTT